MARPGDRSAGLVGKKRPDSLNRETIKALQAPKLRDRLASLGIDPMVMTAAEFDTHVQNEIALNAVLVKAAGIKSEGQ